MAWTWQTSRHGTLKGNLNGVANTISVKGISGNAITTSPQNTVDLVNVILGIGGKTMVVTENLKYENTEGAVNNE